jgi:CelD/BcsL family acetyltransferase involved in cellulose biosynthesis
VDPVADPRWRELAENAPGASIFHRPEWLGLLRDAYGFEPTAWTLAAADGSLIAGLPVARVGGRLTGRRLVALPFSDSCRPLCREGHEDALPELGALVAAERERAALDLEVRAPLPGSGGQVVEGEVEHVLALSSDVEEVRARFAKAQVRRDIAKAERSGLVGERRTDREGLAAFYALHLRTRRRLGVPTQPRSFILAFERLFAQGLGFVQLVRLEGEPVAAAVFLAAAGTLTYKYSASDFEHRKLHPNHLMLMEGIRWGCEHGCHTLDMGKTEVENEGLRKFKRSWGAEERPLPYTHFGSVKRVGGGDGPASRLAATVIRRSPPIVGRLVGAALYRHAG